MRAIKIALGMFCLCLPGLVPAAERPVAGTASIVAGPVIATGADGVGRVLRRDDAVHAGDRVVTGQGAYVRMGFIDGGSIVLRPGSEFAIVDYRFAPGSVDSAVQVVPPPASAAPLKIGEQGSPVGNVALFRLLRGGFRAVSGLIGKINREEYAVGTPVATIGIRGTVFWSVACDAACAADGIVQAAVPSGQAALGGTVSAVDQGSIVVVSTAGKTAELGASQFLLTTASGTHVVLPSLPAFLGAESWLGAAEAAAAPAPVTAAPSAISSATLATVPTVGSLALAAVIGIAVVATDTDDNGSGTTPTGTAPTQTAR